MNMIGARKKKEKTNVEVSIWRAQRYKHRTSMNEREKREKNDNQILSFISEKRADVN